MIQLQLPAGPGQPAYGLGTGSRGGEALRQRARLTAWSAAAELPSCEPAMRANARAPLPLACLAPSPIGPENGPLKTGVGMGLVCQTAQQGCTFFNLTHLAAVLADSLDGHRRRPEN